MTLAHFQIALKMVQIGCARVKAWLRSIQLGISSGPAALCIFILVSKFKTVSEWMVKFKGIGQTSGPYHCPRVRDPYKLTQKEFS